MTTTSSLGAWGPTWAEARALDLEYRLCRHDQGQWVPLASGFEARDLGLAGASGGMIEARHLRRVVGESAREWRWLGEGLALDFLYVYSGTLTVVPSDGLPRVLGVRDAVQHSPDCRSALVDASADCELLVVNTVQSGDGRVVAPVTADVASYTDGAVATRSSSCVFLLDRREAYVAGAGPRTYFEYRDLGAREPTDGRVHLHLIRAVSGQTSPSGGTGWHTHSMSQWYIVLGGVGNIRVEHQPACRMERGDAMCIGAFVPHDEFEFSRYLVSGSTT